ncbi:MAG: serine hydrolase domain-containing protein, partial [Bacteroidota bacterium]
HQLISKETLETMKNDKARLNPGFDYGYGIWQVRTIPLLMPEKSKSWGVLGVRGTIMFYHPMLNAYLIGSFNHVCKE